MLGEISIGNEVFLQADLYCHFRSTDIALFSYFQASVQMTFAVYCWLLTELVFARFRFVK